MPVILNSTYKAPSWLRGGHLQTIHPVLFRQTPHVTTRTERLELDDGDFLDIEWSSINSDRLAIISHGLEGSSRAKYVQGMAAALNKRGWDVLAWNFRSCGDNPNRLPSFYHSGKTEDLEIIIRHALRAHSTSRIDLIGFSLGANLILKYLGENPDNLHPAITRAVAFSAPCELASCAHELSKWHNRIYMGRFMKTLRRKIMDKHLVFPDAIDISNIHKMRTFAQFDDRYTAPLHGFQNADDYWKRSSSRQFLEHIRIPTLLVSAANDPLLGPSCYPFAEAKRNDHFFLEVPQQGGHVGFTAKGEYWSETRAAEFLEN